MFFFSSLPSQDRHNAAIEGIVVVDDMLLNGKDGNPETYIAEVDIDLKVRPYIISELVFA